MNHLHALASNSAVKTGHHILHGKFSTPVLRRSHSCRADSMVLMVFLTPNWGYKSVQAYNAGSKQALAALLWYVQGTPTRQFTFNRGGGLWTINGETWTSNKLAGAGIIRPQTLIVQLIQDAFHGQQPSATSDLCKFETMCTYTKPVYV